jgi:hypothetical protein
MSMSDDPRLEELGALRARAYGPLADIHEDAAALARLRELEAGTSDEVGETSNAQTAHPLLESPVSGGSTSANPDHAWAKSGSGFSASSSPVVAVESPVWWRRRIPVLWTAAGVLAGVALGMGVMLLGQPAPTGRVAVLHGDPDAVWPNDMFGARPEDGQRYNEFHGLTVVTYEQSTGDGGSRSCLAVLTTPDGTGYAAGGCGAGPFPATVPLQVTSLFPQTTRDEFPEGTSLQFVQDGAQVRVYAASPITGRPTP